MTGAALFVDISGFTPLTEALGDELGERRGAEELALNLDRIFEAVIDDLYAYGGEVLYFSGDAITCWLEGDDGARAVACALQMQETMSEVGVVTTPGGTSVPLAIKVAVAVGEARRFVVGDPDIQLIDVLAGRLIDDLAATERLAEQGEVVVEHSVLRSLGERVVLSEQRIDLDGGTTGAVVGHLLEGVPRSEVPTALEPIPAAVAQRWLIPTVAERLEAAGGAFLAELRTVYPIFVKFGGLDFDRDPEAIGKLDRFIQRVQNVLTRYGGSLLQLTLGDKGAYLYGVFGSPRAHEDDAVRAASAALELRDLSLSTEVLDIRIGLTGGRVFSGTYGHPLRRTFTCLGDPVNLAARLMSGAGRGQIYSSAEVMRATIDHFEWEELGATTLKGKREPVLVARLRGARHLAVDRHLRYPLPMVGRDLEVARIQERLEAVTKGSRAVVGIAGEAGMGKSRLVADLIRAMRASNLLVAFGEAQAFGTNTSYLVWREVWATLFELSDERDLIGDVLARLERLGPTYLQRAPLLGSLLGLDIPDNPTTASFDAKLRKTSLENLLAEVLRATAREEPLVIVLEDVHWMDQASFDLLEVLVRDSEALPVLFLVVYRSEIDQTLRDRLGKLPSFEEMVLTELPGRMVREVISAKLRQQFGSDVEPPSELVELIVSRAEGNPFYVEELINFVRELGIDPEDPRMIQKVEVPESLNALVLSRVDSLAQAPRATLKVASVVGREFEPPMLLGVYPDLGSPAEVALHLEKLGEMELVVRDRKEDESWIFRHAVTRDVAYGSIPYSMRSGLHEAAGLYFETRHADALDLHLDLLAHHYWHSDNRFKKIEYQRRAGQAARGAYANAAAIEYFERLADLLDEEERPAVLRELGEVLELTGDWERAEQVEMEALVLAEALDDQLEIGWSEVTLAEVLRKRGRFNEATARLDRALEAFESTGDLAGKGRVLHLAGTVAAQHGDFEAARSRYEESLSIREELGDRLAMASLLSNLGIVTAQAGDVDESDRFHKRAVELRTSIGDRWAIGVSNMNLGMNAMRRDRPKEARTLFAKARRLGREVGDSWMVALSQHNLGNANRRIGDLASARRQYAESAQAFQRYGDRWALAQLFEDIAILAADEGEAVAGLELVGAADRLREQLETPRGPVLEKQLVDGVIEADLDLGEEERSAARRRGNDMELSEAVNLAISCCRLSG